MVTSQPATIEKKYREFEGEVVGTNSQKTIQVRVATTKTNEKYKKQYRTSTKYAVHDEKGEAALGDLVRFRECRPISKTKRWRLLQIIKKQA